MSNDNLDLREDLLKAIGNPFPKNSLSNSLINLDSIEISKNGFERFMVIDILRGISVFLSIFGISQEIFKEENIFSFFIFSKWEGYKFIDYIPNLFIFINGCCIYFSISQNKKKQSKYQLIIKTLKKFSILFSIGLITNYLNNYNDEINLFTFNSLLYLKVTSYYSKLSIIYLLNSIFFIFGMAFISLFISISFFIYIFFIHFHYVNFCGNNNLTPICNCASAFDKFILSYNHMIRPCDPNGFFSILNTIYINFMGISLMYLVRGENFKKKKYGKILFLTFLISFFNIIFFIVFAFLFHIPNIYFIQTTPFIFLSSGIYVLLFFIFYFLQIQKIEFINSILKFFECFGVNSFALMILCQILNFIMYQTKIGNYLDKLFSYEEKPKAGSLIYAFCYLLIIGLIALILYIKKLYFKI